MSPSLSVTAESLRSGKRACMVVAGGMSCVSRRHGHTISHVTIYSRVLSQLRVYYSYPSDFGASFCSNF